MYERVEQRGSALWRSWKAYETPVRCRRARTPSTIKPPTAMATAPAKSDASALVPVCGNGWATVVVGSVVAVVAGSVVGVGAYVVVCVV
jgi:hypothetical protein